MKPAPANVTAGAIALGIAMAIASIGLGACDDEYIPPRVPHTAATVVGPQLTPAQRREAVCKAQSLPPATIAATAGAIDAPHGTVSGIEITGAADEAKARAALGIAKGDAFDAEKGSAAIRRLYQLGDAEDVRLEALSSPAGVELRFVIVPKARLGEVVIHGGSVIDVPELERALHAKAGASYEPATVASSRAALVESLHERGYADASLNVVGTRQGDAVDLCVDLHEGSKITIDRVAFSGIGKVKEDDLRAVLQATGGTGFNMTGGVLDKSKLDDAIVKMNTLYYDRGMIRATVAGKTQRDGDKVNLTFVVEEGPVFTVRRYDITGDLAGDAGAYKKLLTQKSRDPFSPSKLDSDMHGVAALNDKHGHKDFVVQPQTTIDDKNKTVDIVLHVMDPKKLAPPSATPPAPPKPTK